MQQRQKRNFTIQSAASHPSLKIITSFAGLIEPFSNPDLSLYYTLTRKRSSKENGPRDTENAQSNKPQVDNSDSERHILGERTLFITIFDHKERTTRVYTRDNETDIFYSTKSDAPLVDVGHFLLEVEIGAKIDPKGDPVSSDSNNLDSLRKHHLSILEHIQYRLGAGDVTNTIENSWTMKVEDTISALQKLKEERNGEVWKTNVEKGKQEERNEQNLLVHDYFMHSSIERGLLDENRGKWISRRMEMITKETKERFQGMGVEYRVDKQEVEKKATMFPEDIEQLLFWEQYMMEKLLVYEVKEWERLFWNKFKGFLDQIGDNRAEVKERLTREWRANCWRRLDSQMHAAEKRLTDVDSYNLYAVSEWWASSIGQFFEGVEKPTSSLSELKKEIILPHEEIRQRMENEIEDIEFRLRRESELRRFDQFWDDDILFECRYSRSKWLNLPLYSLNAPLEIYSHALKGNKNIIHILFGHRDSDSDIKATICDLPWVTSISRYSPQPPSAIRDPLFIKSNDNDLIEFAKEVRPELDSISTYIFTDAGIFDFHTNKLGNNGKVLISFVAPTSGQNLTLRLKHSGREDGPLKVTLGSTEIQLNPSSKSSLTIDDITLYPNPGPDHLSFVPGRNDIVIEFTVEEHGHFLHDVELLDEAGLKDPKNQIITGDRTD